MVKFSKIFLYILGIPRTLYFNFKYLKFRDAIKLPVLVSHRVCLLRCSGSIEIDAPIECGLIRIGFGDVGIFDQHRSRSIWEVSGKVIFKGITRIGHGSKISVAGTLTLGSDFTITAESQIVCQQEIVFGNDVLISWDNLFLDSDFHKIKINNSIINSPKAIIVGNHVWVGCRCTILKGTQIGSDIVVAANSTITGVFNESNTIIGGNPAQILKRGVTWEP